MTLAKLSNQWFPTMPSLFDRFFEGDLMDWNSSNYSKFDTTLPAVNVKENEDSFLIDVAVPGMEKDDFQIQYENGRLTIASEKKIENEIKEGETITRREFNYQSFKRSFSVSEQMIDSEKIQANYDKGILHIELPKREEVKPKPAKQIAIQ
ncbi:MAG: Hsp20/alpha crystallin family protein [Bacteroidales bacterium]|nr:Hsp20/alpha crystallin family protein [Bacteroidales bacterium]